MVLPTDLDICLTPAVPRTTGALVYTGGGTGAASRTLAWVDRTGREVAVGAPARNYFYARVAPDGKRLSLDVRDQEEDIWIWDLARGVG